MKIGDLVRVREGLNREPLCPFKDKFGVYIGVRKIDGTLKEHSLVWIDSTCYAFDEPYWVVELYNADASGRCRSIEIGNCDRCGFGRERI